MNNFLQPQIHFQLPKFIPTQVRPYNYVESLKYLYHKHPDTPFLDIFNSMMRILFMPKSSVKKVLDKILTNAQNTEPEASCYDSHYLFNHTDTPYSPHKAGGWITTNNEIGQGLLSLVRTVLGSSDPGALEYIAKILGITFTEKNVAQIEKWEGHSFIRNSHTYPRVVSSSVAIELLGSPLQEYSFRNENGHPSFLLLEWGIDGDPLHLFFTLQQDNHRGVNGWESIAPPVEYRFYNKHLIDKNWHGEIHIHDDIRNADDSNSSKTIGTWAGGPSFASKLDWSFLKGRIVKYLFNPQNPESFKIGSALLQAFREMGTEIELCEYHTN